MARERGEVVALLANAAATGVGVPVQGGNYMLDIVAGTGGATVGLQRLGPDGVTWLPVGTSAATSSSTSVSLGLGIYRGVVTGGTSPTGIYVSLQGIV